jgi:hypothetical protein
MKDEGIALAVLCLGWLLGIMTTFMVIKWAQPTVERAVYMLTGDNGQRICFDGTDFYTEEPFIVHMPKEGGVEIWGAKLMDRSLADKPEAPMDENARGEPRGLLKTGYPHGY